MEKGKNRGIGHNSKINTSDFKSLNPADPEFLNNIKTLCKDIYKYIQHANNEHRASHGDEYYFEHEIDDKKSCAALNKVEFGVFRRPNPYEKKVFARDAETSLNHASRSTYKLEQLIEAESKSKEEDSNE
jgi:hypothetical protein